MLASRQNLVRLMIGVFSIAALAAILIGCKETNNGIPVTILTAGDDLVPAPLLASGSHQLPGKVVSAADLTKGLGGVQVDLYLEGNPVKQTFSSTNEGLFRFYDLPEGVYTVRFAQGSKAYASATSTVAVFRDGTLSPASLTVGLWAL